MPNLTRRVLASLFHLTREHGSCDLLELARHVGVSWREVDRAVASLARRGLATRVPRPRLTMRGLVAAVSLTSAGAVAFDMGRAA